MLADFLCDIRQLVRRTRYCSTGLAERQLSEGIEDRLELVQADLAKLACENLFKLRLINYFQVGIQT